ncbi:MAG: DUF354 domain-containing protein [Acidilobaceae archaeon]|nr:DUF354 domain-containing protein [Acidilobaceae archaeon]MCX8165681.1 DUF354 domain-containing protein [Acidilobaceae archaeon]MDW7974106.1 DUF354 domain-containing protein [Sulfolobales archaeon]
MTRAVVWLDASTAKRALLSAFIARHLREAGYNTIITARGYDYAVKILEFLDETYLPTGVHGGGTLRGKLLADLGRAIDIDVVVEEWSPKVLISYPSPPAARVAFGRGIPYIALGDTPHGEAMNRLSYPLASVAIFSDFVVNEMERFLLKGFTAVETFRGVDELVYVKAYVPREEGVRALGLEPYSYMVFRPEEFKAHYYEQISQSLILRLARRAAERGVKPVIIPRYKEHLEEAKRIEGALVLEKPFLGLDLEFFSMAVFTGGISMAREAALLGVPGISVFREVISIDKALISMGFPLRYVKGYEEGEQILMNIARDPDGFRVDTGKLLQSLESPLPLISKWVKKLSGA